MEAKPNTEGGAKPAVLKSSCPPKRSQLCSTQRNILFRLPPELNVQIEELRQSQLGPPSRTAVMRELLRVGLSYYPGRKSTGK